MRSNLPKIPPRASLPHAPSSTLRAALYLTLLCCLLNAPPCSQAQTTPREINVLATADLQPVLPALAEAFTHATNIKLNVRYDSSSILATQILKGDPADLFLATDFSFPEKIIAADLADTPEPIAYARGTLVLWARNDSPLQPLTQNTLRDPRVQSLAIPSPDHITYGRAAIVVLTRMKLYDQFKPHLVVAEDLAQTADLIESGKAQLGFLSLTLASSGHFKQIGSFILMPPSAYSQIRQCAVVMKNSAHRADAHAFLDWLRSPPIQKGLPAHGLDPIQ